MNNTTNVTMNGNEVMVVLPASGGCDGRLSSNIPTQFIDVCGKPIIAYTIDAMHCIPWISRVVVPIPLAWSAFCNSMKARFGYTKVDFVIAGDTRHRSIHVGLKAIPACRDSDILIIHDAARPFLEETFLSELVSAAINYGASGAIRPLVSSLLKGTQTGFMESSLQDDGLRESHTPQVFTYGLVMNAYDVSSCEDMESGTDCLELVRKYCSVSPKLIDGPEYLWKVTHKKDLVLLENIIRAKNESLGDRDANNKRKYDELDDPSRITTDNYRKPSETTTESSRQAHELLNVFVGGFNENTSEESLKKFFIENGVVPVDLRMIYKNDGRSAGFGYATFDTTEHSRRCTELNGRLLDGYKLQFTPAQIQPKTAMISPNMTSAGQFTAGRGGNKTNNNINNNDTATKLLRVKNLSIDTTTDTLTAEFKGAKNICIVKDHVTGLSSGYGFVEYHDINAAVKARDRMQGKEIDGHSIQIVYARAGETFGVGRGRSSR